MKKDEEKNWKFKLILACAPKRTKYANGSIKRNKNGIKIMRFWAPHHFPDVTALITQIWFNWT